MEVDPVELKKLQATLDYLLEVIQDVIGGHASVPVKLKYMHECVRIHELASELISDIQKRSGSGVLGQKGR